MTPVTSKGRPSTASIVANAIADGKQLPDIAGEMQLSGDRMRGCIQKIKTELGLRKQVTLEGMALQLRTQGYGSNADGPSRKPRGKYKTPKDYGLNELAGVIIEGRSMRDAANLLDVTAMEVSRQLHPVWVKLGFDGPIVWAELRQALIVRGLETSK